MKNYSKTYTGAIATLLVALFSLSEAEALSLVNALIVVSTTLFTLYGRYRAGGVSSLGFK